MFEMCYCMVWVWTMYACVLIVCYYFSGDRIERRVYWGRGGLRVSRGRGPGTSHSRQAIYTWCISDPIHLLCIFLKVYQTTCFYVVIVLVAIICWLKLHKPNCYHPWDDPSEHLFDTLVVVAWWLASKPLGKISSGTKNFRLGTLKEKFRKCFRKPWSSIYSTEMFSKMVLCKWSWTWRKTELVVLQKGIGVSL
jgi:hypothetical protein